MHRFLLVLMLLLAVTTACTSGSFVGSDDPANPADPGYPSAALISATESGGTCCFYPSDGEAQCPVLITGYGTKDELDRVVAYYRALGFHGHGGPSGGAMIRWIGTRDGDATTWRKVDIATGEVAGRSRWVTAFEIFAPDCG
jgi:hypothetical protein